MDGGRPDNDEAIATADELFRVALMAVGQATELVLRARMEQERRLLAQARADQAHVQAARTAERDAARVVYLAPQQESWWANATIDDVAWAWSTARAWSRYDPQAIHAQEAIAKTVARRWGVDIEAVAAGGRTDRGSAGSAAADAAAAVDDAAAAADRSAEAVRNQTDLQPEPTFGISVFENEAWRYPQLTKAQALARIDQATGPAHQDQAKEYFADYEQWFGKDRDVDAALSRKWPDRFPEDDVEEEAAAADRSGEASRGESDDVEQANDGQEAEEDQDEYPAETRQERDERPATEPQMSYIRDRGLDPGTPLTRDEATAILTAFEERQKQQTRARAREIDAEAAPLFADGAPPTGRRLEELTGAEREQAERLVRQAGIGEGAPADSAQSIPQQQAAYARRMAAPGFPLPADAAVRMGPGQAKPKPAAGPQVTPGRDQGQSR